MRSLEVADEVTRLIVRNVGGIDETEVSFSPGVTILAGRNATNRTSLLRSIMTGLGSEDMAIKGDADAGAVELTIGDATYARTISRAGRSVQFEGDPYLEDPEVADLFAFLLESNEVRNAVVRNEDLRGLIVRPIDTEAIESRTEQLQREKRELDREEAEIEDGPSRLRDARSDLESSKSSKTCSCCGERSYRTGRRFVCTNDECAVKQDHADRNASVNVAWHGVRRISSGDEQTENYRTRKTQPSVRLVSLCGSGCDVSRPTSSAQRAARGVLN